MTEKFQRADEDKFVIPKGVDTFTFFTRSGNVYICIKYDYKTMILRNLKNKTSEGHSVADIRFDGEKLSIIDGETITKTSKVMGILEGDIQKMKPSPELVSDILSVLNPKVHVEAKEHIENPERELSFVREYLGLAPKKDISVNTYPNNLVVPACFCLKSDYSEERTAYEINSENLTDSQTEAVHYSLIDFPQERVQ